MRLRLRPVLLVLLALCVNSIPTAALAASCACGLEDDKPVNQGNGYVETLRSLPATVTPGSAVDVRIEINLGKRTVTVWRGAQVEATFPVGVGKPKTPSPVGSFTIRRKAAGWGGGFGIRFMELDVPWGTFGIHGTNKPYSVGGRLSGGCFRMHNSDVVKLYSMVKVGTPVLIVDPTNSHHFRRELSVGSRGSDVYLLQQGLANLGYLNVRPDGIYGPRTTGAVLLFQAMHGLRPTGRLDEATAEMASLRIIDGWPSFAGRPDR